MTDVPGEGYPYRHSQLLKKLLSAKGGEPIHELAPELVPVIVVDEDPFDFRVLREVTSWARNLAIGPTAAITSVVGVRNPVGSTILVVFESVVFRNPDAAAHTFTLSVAGAAANPGVVTGVLSMRDTRARGNPQAQAITNSTLAAGPGSGLVTLTLLPNTSFVLPWAETLQQGEDLVVFSDAVNLAVAASFIGYERFREQSE